MKQNIKKTSKVDETDDKWKPIKKVLQWNDDIKKMYADICKDANFTDDISGKSLPKNLCIKAREEDMMEFQKHNVYTEVPIEECLRVTGKMPIGVRWIDVSM